MNRGFKLLSALSIGAGLMYLFNPDEGGKRRKQLQKQMGRSLGGLSDLGDRARELYETGRERGEEAWGRADKRGKRLGKQARAFRKDFGKRSRRYMESGRHLGDQARNYTRDSWIDTSARAYGAYDTLRGSLRDRIGGWLGIEQRRGSTTWYGLLGLVFGATFMFLMDPDRGHRRRALLRDKGVHAWKVAEDQIGAKSRHLRNRAQGIMTGARSRAERSMSSGEMRGDSEQDMSYSERETSGYVTHDKRVVS